jgi:hypothetical protein
MKGRELILSGYEHGMKESHDDDDSWHEFKCSRIPQDALAGA